MADQTLQNISVLVLDDEEFMLDTLQIMLNSLGITSICAFTSAKSALTELKRCNAFHLVICDLNMPDMDGVEFLRYLAQFRFAGNIILLSGEDPRTLQMVEGMASANKLRLLGAIQKPMERAALISLLELMTSNNDSDSAQEFYLDEIELRSGMVDALVPYYQPQVDIRTRKVTGVEALARWRHSEYGILAPAVFINQAEKAGLIHQLTDQMLGMAMLQWVNWRQRGIDLQVSVNVSMDCLSRIEFPEQIAFKAKCYDFPIDRLILEITESRLMQNMAVSLDVLSRLCLKRVQLSIDDFGTAYSNLELLQMLPFAELKIDRSFVFGASQNKLKRTILETSAALGKRLEMQIIAEGVESQDDWDCVAAAGCDVIQGYYVARPMPSDELEAWLRDWEHLNVTSNH